MFENPYKFDVLNDEVLRVLEPGGTIEIVGQAKNGTVNQAIEKAKTLGFHITDNTTTNNGYKTTNGTPLTGDFIRYIFKKPD